MVEGRLHDLFLSRVTARLTLLRVSRAAHLCPSKEATTISRGNTLFPLQGHKRPAGPPHASDGRENRCGVAVAGRL